MHTDFILGVNYWPQRKAMYWWSDFDAGEVRQEFTLIRELGLTLVRIFLLWDDFQPQPDQVSAASLRHLVTVADTAAELGLKLDVTFFTGHMSGPNWAQRWLLAGAPKADARPLVSASRLVSSGYHNPFTHPLALQAERVQVETVVAALRNHPGVGVWNLGNEPDLFAWPPDAATGRRWVHDLVSLIHRLDPGRPVTCGLHTDSLLRDNGLRADQVFAETDFAVMHGYPMYASPWWARSPLDPDLVPFVCALTAALSGKPVLMEEFGGCTAAPGQGSYVWEWPTGGATRRQFMAAEEALAEHLAAVLPKLIEVGATGALLWCFADCVPALWNRPPCDFAPHERFFGLVRPDGALKPHAEVLRRFAATRPTVQPNRRPVRLPCSADAYYQAPHSNAMALYRQWLSDL